MMKRRRISESVLKQVGAAAKWRCCSCKNLLSCVFELDHRVALQNGGEDTPDNLQPLCCECHALKTQRERLERTAERRKAIRAAREEAAAKSEPKPERPTLETKKSKKSEAELHDQFVHNRFLRFAFVRK